jgi:hypothetical protein
MMMKPGRLVVDAGTDGGCLHSLPNALARVVSSLVVIGVFPLHPMLGLRKGRARVVSPPLGLPFLSIIPHPGGRIGC